MLVLTQCSNCLLVQNISDKQRTLRNGARLHSQQISWWQQSFYHAYENVCLFFQMFNCVYVGTKCRVKCWMLVIIEVHYESSPHFDED
jgi:hypothetical protein